MMLRRAPLTLSVLLIVPSSSAHATPSTTFWAPSTAPVMVLSVAMVLLALVTFVAMYVLIHLCDRV